MDKKNFTLIESSLTGTSDSYKYENYVEFIGIGFTTKLILIMIVSLTICIMQRLKKAST